MRIKLLLFIPSNYNFLVHYLCYKIRYKHMDMLYVNNLYRGGQGGGPVGQVHSMQWYTVLLCCIYRFREKLQTLCCTDSEFSLNF